MRGGLKLHPFEYQYTEEEEALHNKVLNIIQEVGRHGDYDGRISLLAQGWRKKPNLKTGMKKRTVRTEGSVVR